MQSSKRTPKTRYEMRAKVWLYPGMAGWHFVTLPKKQSDEIKKVFGVIKRGWGSLPVNVTIGKSKWRTSIFPDTKAGAYLLPLKAEMRKREGIVAGQTIPFSLEIRV
ncbi:DUF1905 domain-containing protein [Candidatus Parcubacteria bacterium]|nr:MAG: DUF1905 domain-containing protein [Candidatus Parcubacteria bacterium]